MSKYNIGEELEKIFAAIRPSRRSNIQISEDEQSTEDEKQKSSGDGKIEIQPDELEKMVKVANLQSILNDHKVQAKKPKKYTKKQLEDYKEALLQKQAREEAEAKRQYEIDCFTLGLLHRLDGHSYEEIFRSTTILLQDDKKLKEMALTIVGEKQKRAFDGKYFDAVGMVTQSLNQVLDYADYRIALQHDEMTATPHIVDFIAEQQAAKDSSTSTKAPKTKQLGSQKN